MDALGAAQDAKDTLARRLEDSGLNPATFRWVDAVQHRTLTKTEV